MESLEAAKQHAGPSEAEIERLRNAARQQLSSLTELAGTIGKDIEALRTYPSYKAVSHRFKTYGPLDLAFIAGRPEQSSFGAFNGRRLLDQASRLPVVRSP